MNKKFILASLIVLLIPLSQMANAYNYEINKKIASCTPVSNLRINSTTTYRISGVTNSVCNLKIINSGANNNSQLTCRIPYKKMNEMTNPKNLVHLKKQYCKVYFKKFT